ncbi:hypothetical protein [Vibrio sp. WXL210]|uniref:hypothetical protein n=1 Tax=Vibrio sp. WXL210 TaxID=3450709 RepID=UPI003EC89D75
MSSLAPIVLFVFNRPLHTKRTLEHLILNEQSSSSHLIIYSDGAKDKSGINAVAEVRSAIRSLNLEDKFLSFTMVERNDNFGLAKSIKNGVNDVLKDYGKVIVLEDDLLCAPDFLVFMNKALNYYYDHPSVCSISGYSPINSEHIENDVYAMPRTSSHGWGTWQNRWVDVDWNMQQYSKKAKSLTEVLKFNCCGADRFGRLRRQYEGAKNSWSVVWGFDQFCKSKITVYPKYSRIVNIGADGTGVNVRVADKRVYNEEVSKETRPFNLVPVEESTFVNNLSYKVFTGGWFKKIIYSILAIRFPLSQIK